MDGQRKLKAAKVLCIGAGGLGSPVAMYLAAAGVGTIGIVDFDIVDVSNLQRQILHGTSDVGRSKLASAKDTLHDLNPHVNVDHARGRAQLGQRAGSLPRLRHRRRRHRQLPDALSRERRVRAARQAERLRQHLPLRRARRRCSAPRTARATAASIPSRRRPGSCRAAPRAACWASCRGSSAPSRPPRPSSSSSASGQTLAGRFLIYDAMKMRFRELKLRKDPDCPVCGTHPTVTALIDYDQFCGVVPAPAAAAPPVLTDADGRHDGAGVEGDAGRRHGAVRRWTCASRRSTRSTAFAGSMLIPLGDLPARGGRTRSRRRVVTQCKSGVRRARPRRSCASRGSRTCGT